MSKQYTSFKYNGEFEICADGRRDQQFNTAVKRALRRISSSEKEVVDFIIGHLNHRMPREKCNDAFLEETFREGQERLDSYLRSLGFDVQHGDIHETFVNKGKGADHGRLSMKITGLHYFFHDLERQGLMQPDLPTNIEGWRSMSPAERAEMKKKICGTSKDYRHYDGMQYIVAGIATSAARIEDPRGLGERMLAAALADKWPDWAELCLRFEADEGGRFDSCMFTTALDWFLAEHKFGNLIQCGLKGTVGERRGWIAMRSATRTRLIESLDADPTRPDFAELKEMAKRQEWEALDHVYLTPCDTGKPSSYGNFNDNYVVPTMERHKVDITSRCGTVTSNARGHRLRAAGLQTDIEHAFHTFKTDIELKNAMIAIKKDYHIIADTTFSRYCGEIITDYAIETKNEISIAREDGHYPETKFDRLVPHNGQFSATEARTAAYS
jgi:hypothetical protein